MKSLILSSITCFGGFILGIMYTVEAAENSALVKVIAVVKGLIGL